MLKDKREIEIFDIVSSKTVGKFSIPEGTLIHCSLEDNVLMLITNLSNVDRYHFYSLLKNTSPEQKNLIQNLSQYEKGKGSHFQLFNCNNAEARTILQGKNKLAPEHINSQVSLVYMIPKNKEKVEVMKIAHEKLQENHFEEETVDMVIQSKVRLR